MHNPPSIVNSRSLLSALAVLFLGCLLTFFFRLSKVRRRMMALKKQGLVSHLRLALRWTLFNDELLVYDSLQSPARQLARDERGR